MHWRAVSVALGSVLSRSAGRRPCSVGKVIALAGRACPGQPTATKRAILVPEISGAGGEVPSVISLSSLSQVLGQVAFPAMLTHLTDEKTEDRRSRVPQHTY